MRNILLVCAMILISIVQNACGQNGNMAPQRSNGRYNRPNDYDTIL